MSLTEVLTLLIFFITLYIAIELTYLSEDISNILKELRKR